MGLSVIIASKYSVYEVGTQKNSTNCSFTSLLILVLNVLKAEMNKIVNKIVGYIMGFNYYLLF